MRRLRKLCNKIESVSTNISFTALCFCTVAIILDSIPLMLFVIALWVIYVILVVFNTVIRIVYNSKKKDIDRL